jgi:hypothetical protein
MFGSCQLILYSPFKYVMLLGRPYAIISDVLFTRRAGMKVWATTPTADLLNGFCIDMVAVALRVLFVEIIE